LHRDSLSSGWSASAYVRESILSAEDFDQTADPHPPLIASTPSEHKGDWRHLERARPNPRGIGFISCSGNQDGCPHNDSSFVETLH